MAIISKKCTVFSQKKYHKNLTIRANFKTNKLGNCQVERIDNEQPELKKKRRRKNTTQIDTAVISNIK